MQPTDESLPEPESSPEPPPNGPAKVSTDNKKERFKLDYGGETVFQAGVKLIRDEKISGLRDAAARLFVVSKSDGWDVVTQTVRIAAVGSLPGDILTIDGHCPVIDDAVSTEIVGADAGSPCVYCASHDWLLSVDFSGHVCRGNIALARCHVAHLGSFEVDTIAGGVDTLVTDNAHRSIDVDIVVGVRDSDV